MKLPNSLLALAALSLITSAFPQEESSTPSPPGQETTSATVETTPEETKSPSTATEASESSPSAERKETRATPTGRKAEASTAATKPAIEATSQPGKSMNVEAAIKENENRWEAAVASHTISIIERLIAPDYIGVSAKGKFVNRSGLLGDFKSDKDTYKSTKVEKLNVRAFGKDLAVATGRARETGTDKDGKSFDKTFLFTDTWMQRNGQWQCVASQAVLRGEK
jgi:ketosteroid isomerase-like protein